MDIELIQVRARENPRLRSCFTGDRIEYWPRKFALREALLDLVVSVLQAGPTWTEQAITQELAEITGDPATLRRALVDTRRLLRSPDGRSYRLGPRQEPGTQPG